MGNHIVIPARLNSTRLPRKLLLSDTGMSLVWHTIQCAKSSKLSNSITVATDSREIFDETEKYVDVIMTGQYNSGTERVANCCGIKNFNSDDIIVNLQGDEPELEHGYIDDLITGLKLDEDCDIATLASLTSQDEYVDPNVVKVVINNSNRAMYFSRCSIPWAGFDDVVEEHQASDGLKHIGIYAYRMSFLNQLNSMESPRECHKNEKLEQLQWLENGFNIKVLVRNIKSVGIDTREEYDNFVRRWKMQKKQDHPDATARREMLSDLHNESLE